MKFYISAEIHEASGDYGSKIEDAWITYVRRFDQDDDYNGFILQIVLPAWQYGPYMDYGNLECWAQTAIYISNIDPYGDKWKRSFRYWKSIFVRKGTQGTPVSRQLNG